MEELQEHDPESLEDMSDIVEQVHNQYKDITSQIDNLWLFDEGPGMRR
jgi:hypothetical protein